MAKFEDTPKRTAINRAGLEEIYQRQFGAVPDGWHMKGLKKNISLYGLCECGCGGALNGNVEWEHKTPLALQIQEEGKPPPKVEWQAYLPACHKLKTVMDLGRIAKAKSQARLTGQQARRKRRGKGLIQSRGFDKRYRKKMNGEVVLRDGEKKY